MAKSLLCSAENSRVVLVDVQIRLAAAMPEPERAAMVKNSLILLQAADALYVPVTYTEQYPKGLGPTVPALLDQMPSSVDKIEKTSFSCRAAEGFLTSLNSPRREQIILAGQEAHVCVLQTACDLAACGFQVFVVEDAVCSRSLDHKRNALERMRDSGVVVTNVESVLFEWLRDARHPQFKALSELIR